MKIMTAEHMGFCFGVKNAVNLAQQTAREGSTQGRAVCSSGSVIHNRLVMDQLEAAGLSVINDLSEAPEGAVVIVRSHGEGKDFFRRAEALGLQIVNATCPRVERIQRLAEEAHRRGDGVVIVGDAAHPEVRGISGWCAGTARIAGDEAEARALRKELVGSHRGKRVVILAQTTFDAEHFQRIVAAMTEVAPAETTEAGPDFIVKNTVCDATRNRQKSAAELAQKVDAMLVIGDKNSSNSRKLFEIAKKTCKNSFFIEKSIDLPLKDMEICNRIGITAGASTPEQIIKEVITVMSEIKNESYETNPMHQFMDDIDKNLRLPRVGEIITGEVIQVNEKDVIVNIGCKKDGVIPRNEVTLETDQTLPDLFKEGDEVQAKVLKNDDGDGNILLSKKRVVISEHWEDINAALEDRASIEVTVVKEVNGGVIATFHEISGFIPVSQLSDRYVETTEEFVGKTFPVKVMRVDQKRNKVVFSHKAVLNEERQRRMHEIWDTLNVGDVIDGKIMRFTEYGAFVDIGGIDGLLHISEISWGKLRHPEEVLSIDQEIKVKILSMNKEKEKISLGYKQNLPEPWSIINEKYQVGQIIKGRAVQLKEYGVFVELEPGLDGLVHISEIAFKRVNNISDEIQVGQEITAKILEIDKDRKRISLSIKETLDREAESRSDDEAEPVSAPRTEHDGPRESVGEKIQEALEEAREKVEELAEEAKEKVEEFAEEAKEIVEEIAEEVVEHVKEAVVEFKEGITEAATDLAEGVKEAAEDISEMAEDAHEAVREGYEEAVVPTELPLTDDHEAFDPNKDPEFEMPDPDGLDKDKTPPEVLGAAEPEAVTDDASASEDETSTAEAPAEALSEDETSTEEASAEASSEDETPTEEAPAEALSEDETPSEEIPAEASSEEEAPTEEDKPE